MSLTGIKKRVAQVVGILGGVFFALTGYYTLPTLMYYSGLGFGTYIYFLWIVWVGIWFVIGYLALYGLVSLIVKVIKTIFS